MCIATFKHRSILAAAAIFCSLSARALVAQDDPRDVQDVTAPAADKSIERPAHLVVLRLSAEMLAAQMNRHVDRQAPVRDVVLGTPVRGLARVVGQLKVAPIPSADKACFDAAFSGTVHSRTVGQNGPVTIYGHSITRFTASKEITFEPGKGFHGGDPKLVAQTQSYTDGIATSRGGLVGRITQRRAAEEVAAAHPTCRAIAHDRASRRIAAAFEENMAERLAQLNRAVDFQTRLAELRSRDGVRRLVARTTPQYLEIADAIFDGQTPAELPVLSARDSGGFPIEFWVHGSVVPEKLSDAIATIFNNPDQSAVVNGMALLPGALGKEAAAALTALASENKVSVQKTGDWVVLELNSPAVSKAVTAAADGAMRR